MKYSLMACDLDGTLLNDNSRISKKNLEYIKKAKKEGVRIIITTGRSYITAKGYIKSVNVNDPAITFNGAVIHDSEKILRKITLKNYVITDLLKLLKDMDYAPIIYLSNDYRYYETLGRYEKDYCEFAKSYEGILTRVNNIMEKKWEDVIRITVIAGDPDIPLLHSEIKNNFGSKIRTIDTYFAQYNFYLFEILDNECSKSKGLHFLCNKFNIKQDQVIACGDNNNDLDMITWAGLGVAMKNGQKSVLKEADYVTERDNNEDGVAEVIERFILRA